MTEHTKDDGRLGLDADQVLTTTRSVRKRLDFEREVSRDTVMRALDIALQAPTGSNRQGWQWVFVDDEDKKAELTRIYADNFARSPILMIPCIEGKPETSGSSAAFWGSLLPAVWSFMLALRERGLGSAWTTLHLINGGEEQAADLLGIPFDRYSQGGLFPIAHTIGTEFRPASRLPAHDLTHWNSWGTRPD